LIGIAAGRFKLGLQKMVYLGNLDARREQTQAAAGFATPACSAD
jgi:GDP-D-mannose dehydratase